MFFNKIKNTFYNIVFVFFNKKYLFAFKLLFPLGNFLGVFLFVSFVYVNTVNIGSTVFSVRYNFMQYFSIFVVVYCGKANGINSFKFSKMRNAQYRYSYIFYNRSCFRS